MKPTSKENSKIVITEYILKGMLQEFERSNINKRYPKDFMDKELARIEQVNKIKKRKNIINDLLND